MIISSRRDRYRMAVRRVPAPDNMRLASLTKQSLWVPFLNSPLPSPGLPSNFPRRTTKPTCSRIPRSWRFFGLILGCFVGITWVLSLFWHLERATAIVPYRPHSDGAYEIVGSNVLPDVPGPVIITDRRGRARWTISIPPDQVLPLSPSDYARICTEAENMANHAAQIKNTKFRGPDGQRHAFHYRDKNFIDVADAQKEKLLPTNAPFQSTAEAVVGLEWYGQGSSDLPLCKKSLTFVLQSDDAGFGVVLMGLWMAYGFAKTEKRAFFVDDSNWGYGRYTTYFKDPPRPSCRPPPASQRIPYPLQARHLLVTPSTFRWIFDHNFKEKFENRRQIGVDRQKPIFSFLRIGYEALFRLNDQDREFYEKRIKQLRANKNGIQVGIHVRRGDRHPFELQYENSYIPLDVYIQGAEGLVKSLTHPLSQPESTTTIVASDDPDVYLAPEMRHTLKAQTYISLVSKSTLEAASTSQKQAMDANSGWEGGFFNNLFWSLGSPSSRPVVNGSPSPSKYFPSSPSDNTQSTSTGIGNPNVVFPGNEHFHFQPSENALRLRAFVARAYLLDLAVLATSDAIVCGVSSVSCRLLGVMLGWEKAIEQKRWKNVDGSLHWQGFIW
ncbi:hypothetical protein PRK78_005603 [Emydomyces testavorans]|uniref:Uncharacterized protein n=1 Tax=Emydomyces testavorans TaxID=2070801 RepID=A0AAF0IK74_9EURO|nr:hypothetical protein PRK78_005603 [Emydomyces testavorans]